GRRSDDEGGVGWPSAGFVPEPGDAVAFVAERSLLAWPTPLDLNFMTGHSPSWKRNVYYRLSWRKPSGATLDLVWRYQQWVYDGAGGASPAMPEQGATGLIRGRIAGASAASNRAGSASDASIAVATAYLAASKGWLPESYRLARRGLSADGSRDVLL